MSDTNNIRYVHATNLMDTTKCRFSGITIGYVRQGSCVVFSYSLCHKNDEYRKDVGRSLTREKLDALFAKREEFFHSSTGIDNEFCVGVMNVDSFKSRIGRMNIFSDQFIDNLDMFDFKHSTISDALVDFVYGHVVFFKYPNSKL